MTSCQISNHTDGCPTKRLVPQETRPIAYSADVNVGGCFPVFGRLLGDFGEKERSSLSLSGVPLFANLTSYPTGADLGSEANIV